MPVRQLIQRLRAQSGRPIVSTLAATASIQLLGLVTGVLLARVLGATGRGELAAVVLWVMLLLAVGSFGVTDSVTYHVARRVSRLRVIVGTSAGLALVQGVLLVALGLGLIPLVLSQYPSSVVRAGLLFLVVVPVGLLTLYLASVLNGMQRFVPFNVLRVTVHAVAAAGLVALAATDELTLTTAVYAYIAGQVVALLASIALTLPATEGMERPSRDLAERMFAYGWRSQLSTVSNLLNMRADQLVISVFLSAASLGLYVVAWTMTSVTNLIGSSIVYTALPAIAGTEGAADRRAAAREQVGFTLLASAAMAIPLFIFAPVVLEFAFGEEFREATDLTRVLLAASVMLAVGRVLGAILKGANRPLDAGWAEGIGLAVTAVGLAALLPIMGTMGAAVTSCAAYSATAAFALRWVNRELGSHGLELLVPTFPGSARRGPRSRRGEEHV